jgi:integrase
MALYRRGDEWWYHFWYQGQHIQQRTHTTNKQEARRKEAIHKAQLVLGQQTATPKENPTFADFAPHYLKYSQANKPSYGVERYYINGTLVPFFGKLGLNKITPFHVELYKQKRLSDGLKKSSINREIGLLKSMLSIAVKWELTDKNGAKEAKLFKLDDPLPDRVLAYEEETRLLAACDQPELRYRAPHLKSIILVALYTGLRRGEILRLRWSDINLQQNMLIVRKSKTRSGQGRRVDLNSVLREWFLSLFEQGCGEWVFPSPKRFQKPGEPERHIGDVKNAFRRAVRLAGIEPITFHQLRHTFCSRLADAGVPLPVIQDLAGHASIMMTRRYTHPSNDLKKRAVELLLMGRNGGSSATKSATKPATEAFEQGAGQNTEPTSEGRSIRSNGRPVRARTADLHRVKVAL